MRLGPREVHAQDDENQIPDKMKKEIEQDYVDIRPWPERETAGPTTPIMNTPLPTVKPPVSNTGPLPGSGLHPQDDSLPALNSALRNGYDSVRWHIRPEYEYEVDNGICQNLDQSVFSIEEIISGLNYSAPMFEMSHVGCKCSLEVFSEMNPELEPYFIGPGERWA